MVLELEELERRAMASESLPNDIPQPQQLLFLSFRNLYREYRCGAISREEARKEKAKLLTEYALAIRNYDLYIAEAKRRNRLSAYLSELNIHGCERCRLAARIFDGREP